jgi:hypothetical protein
MADRLLLPTTLRLRRTVASTTIQGSRCAHRTLRAWRFVARRTDSSTRRTRARRTPQVPPDKARVRPAFLVRLPLTGNRDRGARCRELARSGHTSTTLKEPIRQTSGRKMDAAA